MLIRLNLVAYRGEAKVLNRIWDANVESPEIGST